MKKILPPKQWKIGYIFQNNEKFKPQTKKHGYAPADDCCYIHGAQIKTTSAGILGLRCQIVVGIHEVYQSTKISVQWVNGYIAS